MEPFDNEDAEDNLSQALSYRNSLKRNLFGEEHEEPAMESVGHADGAFAASRGVAGARHPGSGGDAVARGTEDARRTGWAGDAAASAEDDAQRTALARDAAATGANVACHPGLDGNAAATGGDDARRLGWAGNAAAVGASLPMGAAGSGAGDAGFMAAPMGTAGRGQVGQGGLRAGQGVLGTMGSPVLPTRYDARSSGGNVFVAGAYGSAAFGESWGCLDTAATYAPEDAIADEDGQNTDWGAMAAGQVAARSPAGRGRGGRGSGRGRGRVRAVAAGRRDPMDSMPPLPSGRGRGKRAGASLDDARCTRGRGISKVAYKPPRQAVSEADVGVDSENPIGDDDDIEVPLHGNLKEVYDKADWSFENTRTFCEVCIEEKDAGNRANGIMSTRGYKNIAEKYLKHTGLRHSRLQLKNKWDLLKGLYSFWLQINRDTGLGWNDALGTVSATEEYWQRVTKGHSDWKKLKKGPPEHEDLLRQMFGGIVVDGSSACVPGEELPVIDGEENMDGRFDGEENMDGRFDASPSQAPSVRCSMRSRSIRHGGSSTATSPLKHTKNPMVKVMKNIHATLERNCNISNKVMLGEHLDEKMKEVLDIAVQYGAREGSVEHFMATQLFAKAEHRSSFKAFSSMEGRLIWLKRWCTKEGLM